MHLAEAGRVSKTFSAYFPAGSFFLRFPMGVREPGAAIGPTLPAYWGAHETGGRGAGGEFEATRLRSEPPMNGPATLAANLQGDRRSAREEPGKMHASPQASCACSPDCSLRCDSIRCHHTSP